MTTQTAHPAEGGPVRYLSRTEVAKLLGLAPSTLSRYRLPEADVIVGDVRGWSETTILEWHAARPSQAR